MRYFKTMRCFKTLLCALCLIPSARAFAVEKPNILYIVADDLGYSDLGCYGGEVNTPNLDRLASNGLRFTQFYNTGRCCPTRGSLLTGLYPHQSGIGHMMSDDGTDGYRGDLSNNALTIAEVLKTEGYKTYISGKWHVTPHIKPNGPKYNWPLQRGFDHFYGSCTRFPQPGAAKQRPTLVSLSGIQRPTFPTSRSSK